MEWECRDTVFSTETLGFRQGFGWNSESEGYLRGTYEAQVSRGFGFLLFEAAVYGTAGDQQAHCSFSLSK